MADGLFLFPEEGTSILPFLIWPVFIIIMMLYGQRFQAWMALNDISRSLAKLKMMKEHSRTEAVEYVKTNFKPGTDPSEKIDQFLEYFTILPVDLDPSGIVGKIEHVITQRDDRMRAEIRSMAPEADKIGTSTTENVLEVATVLNLIYKIIRHFYLLGKRTHSFFVIIQLQMIMPLIMQEAEALNSALDAFKQSQPIGDGIGAMVVGGMMLDKEKKTLAQDTIFSESEHNGRSLYLMKAEGPGGNVGQPGKAIEKMIGEMDLQVNSIIMVDAALKLEGEKTGSIAEGMGAAIGGIGVDRFKIEEVALKNNIPVYAVVIKQSILDAISVMKKEIAETTDKVVEIVKRLIDEKTKAGDKVLLVGVGNTIGVAQ